MLRVAQHDIFQYLCLTTNTDKTPNTFVGNGLDRSAYTVTAGSKPASGAPGAALPTAVNFTAPQAERSRAFPTKYNLHTASFRACEESPGSTARNDDQDLTFPLGGRGTAERWMRGMHRSTFTANLTRSAHGGMWASRPTSAISNLNGRPHRVAPTQNPPFRVGAALCSGPYAAVL